MSKPTGVLATSEPSQRETCTGGNNSFNEMALTEAVRDSLTSSVESVLEFFLKSAMLEDLTLLDGILELWYQHATDCERNVTRNYIANAAATLFPTPKQPEEDVPNREQQRPPSAASDSCTPTLDERTAAQLRRDVVEAVQGQGQGENGRDYYDARQRFFAAALVTKDLDTHEAASLAICQRMIRENRGCDTPIEEFLTSFLGSCLYRAVDIKELKGLVEDAEANFNDAIVTAQKMAAEYPDLVSTERQEKSRG